MNIIIAIRNFIGNAALVCIAAAAVITLTEMISYRFKARKSCDGGSEGNAELSDDGRNQR